MKSEFYAVLRTRIRFILDSWIQPNKEPAKYHRTNIILQNLIIFFEV